MKKIFVATTILVLSISTGVAASPNLMAAKISRQATPKGDRILGIYVSNSRGSDYENAFRLAKEAGIQVTELSLAWDMIETSPGNYGNIYLGIANAYYPARNTQIALAINPIDTNNVRLPPDLKNKRLDDAVVIERFNKMLDYVFSQIEDLKLASLSIGNEIDICLSQDKAKWAQYETFFKATSGYIKAKRPELKIGSKATFYGIIQNNRQELKTLNQYSDVIMVTYYPLNSDFTVKEPSVVKSDFAKLASVCEGKPIYMLEVGYPSSLVCNSSQTKQMKFVREVFKAWDEYAAQIRLINFNWLHDKSKSEVDGFAQYYGIFSNKFKGYLLSLGLRAYNGDDKAAFKALRTEAKARGW